MDTYKLITKRKQYSSKIVQMVRSPPSGSTGKVVFVNFDRNKCELTGTTILLVTGKYGREHLDIR